MSAVDELFKRLEKLELSQLLMVCAQGIESKLEQKRLDAILLLLETRLQKRRMMNSFGMSEEKDIK